MKTVKIASQGADYAALDEFIHFQGTLKFLSDENYKKLKKQIIKLGFSEPLAVWLKDDQKILLNGHQRVATLKRMRDEDNYEVPYLPYSVVEAKDEAEAKKKVLSLASEYGKVTEEGLAQFANESSISIADIQDSFCFDSIDYQRVSELATAPVSKEVDVKGHTRTIGADKSEDEIQEQIAKTEPRVKKGEIYILGDHVLMCGDCTSDSDLEKLYEHGTPDFTLTDPPYNVGITYGKDTDDKKSAKEYQKWCETWFNKLRSQLTVFTPGTVNLAMWYKIKEPLWLCPWRKPNQCSSSKIGGFNTWEPLLMYGKILRRVGHDSFDMPVKMMRVEHPVAKTLDAWQKFLEVFSDNDHIVFDPFAGSGTTMIAAEMLGRKSLNLEIDERFCTVIIDRWESLTGKKAKLYQKKVLTKKAAKQASSRKKGK